MLPDSRDFFLPDITIIPHAVGEPHFSRYCFDCSVQQPLDSSRMAVQTVPKRHPLLLQRFLHLDHLLNHDSGQG